MSTAAEAESLPFFLRGNYAPVPDERTETSLVVDGEIPSALRGLYVRNGPNPKGKAPSHWFFGDGMLHGLRLEDGRAAWYRNRWVRTRHLGEAARVVREDGSRDLGAGPGNTHVIRHAGRLLALSETTQPWEIDPDLGTVGLCDLGGRLDTGMTAHPKVCPATGELHFFDYNWFAPFLTYHCASADGEIVRSLPIEVPGPTMMHDFAITSGHVLFFDLPVVFDLERAMRGTMPYRWDDDYGARVGVLPRGADRADVRWFDVQPCYVFHPFNAWEDAGRIVVDVARYPELWREDSNRFDLACLHRWEFDLGAGSVRETPLDDRPIEFPRVDDRLCGQRHRYGYAVRNVSSSSEESTSILRYDLETGSSVEHDFGPGRVPGEAVFAPDPSSTDEDGGWLLCFVYDAASDRSELAILDAAHVTGRPVATVKLPTRVPFGFHGSWMADEPA